VAKVFIDGETLTVEDVVAVARDGAKVEIPKSVREKVEKCRQVFKEFMKEKKVVYGATTGFGALGSVIILQKSVKELQFNLIRSHLAGVGKPLEPDEVLRLMFSPVGVGSRSVNFFAKLQKGDP